ncbi:hypothetical protein HHK36_024020 [Tetracentron sinense]|uniref:Subtilisin-like protease fibronectin type-III domain-containing protein n=1 Tax=Tetracentron sinense TaxID=13715 RepID=A0A835D6E0_TETSI|nr:hypothetical protein HHK36_024020 [Tetracentron sinense]
MVLTRALAYTTVNMQDPPLIQSKIMVSARRFQVNLEPLLPTQTSLGTAPSAAIYKKISGDQKKHGLPVVGIASADVTSTSVEPPILKFKKMGEEKTFKGTLKGNKEAGAVASDYVFGQLTWSDGDHVVKSPIVVMVAT